MSDNRQGTALVTGANSGIGFEAAAQLVEEGFATVVLACRTEAKAEAAKAQLVERTGKDVFVTLGVDLSEPASANQAADQLAEQKQIIDLLILNAGMGTGEQRAYNSDGVELTVASTLIGHHVMTLRLLQDDLLAPGARIVIAGSEVARADTGIHEVPDFTAFAAEHYAGDLESALESVARFESPYTATPMSFYATCKVYVNWWAAALARRLPPGITVNAVSPGSVPSTGFLRNQAFLLRRVVFPLVDRFGHRFGLAWTAADGARRYLDAGQFDDATNGHFFASPPGKVTGPMQIQKDEQFLDHELQEAGWNVIVRLGGGVDITA